jgi:DNA modification methylase
MSLPKPYYEHGGIVIYNADCREILPAVRRDGDIVISDPPFNIGYKYGTYKDNLPEGEYSDLVKSMLTPPSCIIHYPEDMFRIASWLSVFPTKCVAWVHNTNTPRHWRMAAWFGIEPDFSRVKQPYKNMNDKRIISLMERGGPGADLYDWWDDDIVRNISSEKTDHPCQMPISVLKKIIAVTEARRVIDPFMGSGTTVLAAKDLGVDVVGIEIEERYAEIAVKRLAQEILPL